MADEADVTAERLAIEQDALIRRIRAAAERPRITYTHCRNCQEELQSDRKGAGFCDQFCRDDYEAMLRARQRQGEHV